MSDAKQKKVRQALKAHVKDQHALDKAQVALVQRAHKVGIPMDEVVEILGISLRTVYNRLEGKGPRVGAKWRE